jgi:hypothetical protein
MASLYSVPGALSRLNPTLTVDNRLVTCEEVVTIGERMVDGRWTNGERRVYRKVTRK